MDRVPFPLVPVLLRPAPRRNDFPVTAPERAGTAPAPRAGNEPGAIGAGTVIQLTTFDFTDAVPTSRTVRSDTDMQHGKLVIAGAPGIVIDAGGLNLVFSKTKLRSDSAAADPGLRIELAGTLKHAKAVERRP